MGHKPLAKGNIIKETEGTKKPVYGGYAARIPATSAAFQST
jgi:hypothetical protein